jgi:hypothetical protein
MKASLTPPVIAVPPRCASAKVNSPIVLTILLLILLGRTLPADEITKWSALNNQLALNSGLASANPFFHSRMAAMAHIAMHNAVNAINPRYESYKMALPLARDASPQAAAATAAYVVFLDQFKQIAAFGFPDHKAELDAAYASSLAAIPDNPRKMRGIQVGMAAAAQILSDRASDGAYLLPLTDPNYPQGTEPGQYKFTPGFDFAFETKWGSVRPFAIPSSRSFFPEPPYRINSSRYTADYNEIKRLGGDGVTTPSERTPDQTEIATFWYESSPVGWNRIARIASDRADLNLWQNARLFALLNIASADGYIAVMEAKYVYNFWRPVTAIREGDFDGNPDTTGNPTWSPLLPTPPVPDHDSGHSVQGGACSVILTRIFGDNFRFRTCSTTLPANRCNDESPIMRTFNSFAHASTENGLSRVYVGIHFRHAVSTGIEHGQAIANHAFANYLQPLTGGR